MLLASPDVMLFAILISLVVIGIPAAFLKLFAGSIFASGRGIIGRSIGWGILAGIGIILLHFAAVIVLRAAPPATQDSVLSLGGWTLTAIGAGLLALAAVSLDYWKAVRPAVPRISIGRTIAFLFVSNIWILGGAYLMIQFNALMLFPSCFDPTTNRIVNPFSEPRPQDCRELSN
jgi:hypothetical protein